MLVIHIIYSTFLIKFPFRWTQAEASEIESLGEAKGWDVEYLRPPSKFPELAVDLNNVVFAKSGGRKHNKHQ